MMPVNDMLKDNTKLFALFYALFSGITFLSTVALPTVNPDHNQHSPNENIRLGNYVDGIKTIAAILIEKL